MNASPSIQGPPIQDEAVARGVGWFILVVGFLILTLSSLGSTSAQDLAPNAPEGRHEIEHSGLGS